MATFHPTDLVRKREPFPNLEEPLGLLLGEAVSHLLRNRLARLMSRPLVLIAALLCAVAAGIFAPALLVNALLGILFACGALVVCYLCWYDRFSRLNSINKTLCPSCTSRAWQFCCARCHEPVPALTFWLRGLFLAHCSHCGLRLSIRCGRLLGWCSTCSHEFVRPGDLYRKPTNVIFWLTRTLPEAAQVNGGAWRRLPTNIPNTLKFYHDCDRHSASLMYICADPGLIPKVFHDHLRRQARLVLTTEDIHQIETEELEGMFEHSIFRMTESFESLRKPPDRGK